MSPPPFLFSLLLYDPHSHSSHSINHLISACEIDDVLIEVIHLRPRSRMKKLMKKSCDSYDPSMSQHSLSNLPNDQSDQSTTSPERTYTESEHIGEQIKVEFKKALTNRRPSTS